MINSISREHLQDTEPYNACYTIEHRNERPWSHKWYYILYMFVRATIMLGEGSPIEHPSLKSTRTRLFMGNNGEIERNYQLYCTYVIHIELSMQVAWSSCSWVHGFKHSCHLKHTQSIALFFRSLMLINIGPYMSCLHGFFNKLLCHMCNRLLSFSFFCLLPANYSPDTEYNSKPHTLIHWGTPNCRFWQLVYRV